jgi:hypothetical protein
MGRLLYSCGASSAQRNYDTYIKTNRDITLYTLDLSPTQKEAVRNFAEFNIQPANRDYYYHHFKDNCATRIRDIVDLAVGGQFKALLGDANGRFTLRQHVRRHTWFSPFGDWAFGFLMGQGIDQPITVWEEMFLPSEIGEQISNFSYIDENGVTRRLVSSIEVVNQAKNRPAVLDFPRRQWLYELIVGVILAAVLMFAGYARHNKHPTLWKTVFLAGQGALGLFFGVMGSLLTFMTFFTNHDYTFHNSNVLYINPLLLAAVPLSIMAIKGKTQIKRFWAEHFLQSLWTYVVCGCLLSMLIKLSPAFNQQNQVTQALVLPFAIVLSSIPSLLKRLSR